MKKFTILILLLFILFIECHIADGKLSGVIIAKTELGNLPDVGSKIIIFSKKSIDTTECKDIFLLMMSFRIKKADYISQLMSYDIATLKGIEQLRTIRSQVDTLAERIAYMLITIERLETTKSIVADGNGNYSIDLSPGKYYMIARSGRLKNKNLAEVDGCIEIKAIEIKLRKNEVGNIEFN